MIPLKINRDVFPSLFKALFNYNLRKLIFSSPICVSAFPLVIIFLAPRQKLYSSFSSPTSLISHVLSSLSLALHENATHYIYTQSSKVVGLCVSENVHLNFFNVTFLFFPLFRCHRQNVIIFLIIFYYYLLLLIDFSVYT